MKIKNITSERIAVVMRALGGEYREMTIYLEPNGITDLEGVVLLSHEGAIILEESEAVKVIAPEEIIEESDKSEEIVEEKKEEVIPEKFICDICGAEFASARGLNSHKNKVHSSDE